jgi:nucleoside-diphosphate-sugar epimerase
MKAVVTGATGAVGMALVSALIKKNCEVLVLCRPNSERNARLSDIEGVTLAECSLEDLKYFDSFERYDVFFHLGWGGTTGAARNDMYLQNKNVEYTIDAVNLANRLGCKTFVGAGSQAEYGRVTGKLSSSTPTDPENGYGIAKLAAGKMSRILCRELGIKQVWARILSVYGEYDGENSMVMSTVNKILNGAVPEFTPAEQIWDYMYSSDAANALIAIAERGKDGAVYCLGSGEPRALCDYIKMIRDAVDKNAELGIGRLPYANNQVMYLCADISELTEDTGFLPEYSFSEGIARTVEWVRSQKIVLSR